jgi:hypothetical protein
MNTQTTLVLVSVLALGSAGCSTVKIVQTTPTVTTEAVARSGDPLAQTILRSESLGGQILSGCNSYYLKFGRWPTTRSEVVAGMGRAGADLPVRAMTLKEEGAALNVRYTTNEGANGSLTFSPPSKTPPPYPDPQFANSTPDSPLSLNGERSNDRHANP